MVVVFVIIVSYQEDFISFMELVSNVINLMVLCSSNSAFQKLFSFLSLHIALLFLMFLLNFS